MPDIHLKYGGSNAGQVLGCPGSVKEQEGLPDKESEYAKVGTAKHDCMEEILLDDRTPDYFAGLTVKGVTITPEMVAEDLVPALAAFREMCEQYGVTEYEAETFCRLDDDIGGTADFIARGEVDGTTYGIIGDFKFGKGVMVYPDENPQAMFYAMCALHESDAKDMLEGVDVLVAAIIQPNDRGNDDLRVWEFSFMELADFQKQYERAVRESESSRPPLNAGSHCKWCRAAPVCPQKSGQALRALRMQPDDLEILHESLELVGELKDWIRAVEAAAFEQLNAGAKVDGWKLVHKRPIERWHPERVDAAIKYLRRRLGGIKNITKTDILSPAQMRKVIKSKKLDIELDSYTMKQSTGTTMAPEGDKRPAVLAGEAMAAALKSLS